MNSIVIIFGGWGREKIIIRLKELGYHIAAVITPTDVSPKLQKSIDYLQAIGFHIISCDKSSTKEVLSQFYGNTLLSIGFPYILSRDILNSFKVCLNVHPTLLPRYRGPTSGAYILINNESESGSTVHIIDEGMDTGDIILQKKVKLSRFDTIRSLRRKVYAIEPELVADALELLQKPDFRPIPQDKTYALNYPRRRKPEDSEIDPSRPLIELFDTIRACDVDEFPAFFYIEGQKVYIRLWRQQKTQEDDVDML